MKTCSVCQRCYEDAAAVCVENHGILKTERAGTVEMIPNYRLDSVFERDAVGESYLATSVDSDQPFIIKIIAQNLLIGAGEQARQTLEREAQAAADFNHPNIARVYESGWLEGGEFYVVTEAVGDKTLQGFLRNARSLSEAEAVKIARQTAEGLMAAHAAGIVHRAVSPANIILARDPQSQLLIKIKNFDFGGIRQQTAAGKFAADKQIETLRYLSPEQFTGNAVDAQTDVYSLGIVLYEMICGRSPFTAPTSAAIADRQIDEEPLMRLRFDIRALLTHTLKESLQKRPAARLQMDNFVRQLRHITQLILPLGENLPATPQVMLPVDVASDAPTFTESAVEEKSLLEAIAPGRIDAADDEVTEPPSSVGTEEKTTEEKFPLGELAPVFVMKNESDASAAEPIEAADSPAAADPVEPISVAPEQIDEVPPASDVEVEQIEKTTNKLPSLGELAPVFVMKNESDADFVPTESVSAEIEDANSDSFEINSFVEENQTREIPFEFVEENQVDILQNEAVAAQIDEIPVDQISPLEEFAPVFFERNEAAEIPFEAEPLIDKREKDNAASAGSKFIVFPDEIVQNTRKTTSAAPNFTGYGGEDSSARRPPPANRSALIGAGLIALLVSVVLGAFLYNRMQNPAVSEQAAANTPPVVETASETSRETAQTTLPDEPMAKDSAPALAEETSSTTAKRADRKLSEDAAATTEAATKQDKSVQERAAREQPTVAAANGKPQTELNSALDDWVSATNLRNVEQQMNYYAPKLNAYYLTRNTSQGAVRAEKKRIFSRADDVDIQAGKPDITVSPDGQKATMRFRKKYSIKQGQQNRNGEVIQELKWVKADDGWRIVSERDVKVINR